MANANCALGARRSFWFKAIKLSPNDEMMGDNTYFVSAPAKVDKKLLDYIDIFKSKILPTLPVSAKLLMKKYDIPEGKTLGDKLKIIEQEWVNNNFQLSEKQIDKIISR